MTTPNRGVSEFDSPNATAERRYMRTDLARSVVIEIRLCRYRSPRRSSEVILSITNRAPEVHLADDRLRPSARQPSRDCVGDKAAVSRYMRHAARSAWLQLDSPSIGNACMFAMIAT